MDKLNNLTLHTDKWIDLKSVTWDDIVLVVKYGGIPIIIDKGIRITPNCGNPIDISKMVTPYDYITRKTLKRYNMDLYLPKDRRAAYVKMIEVW